jgi:hypothetical protein
MPPNSERRTRSAHSAHMRTATLTRYRDAAHNLRHQHQPSPSGHARFDTSFSRHTHTHTHTLASVSTLSAPQHPCARRLAPSCSSFVGAAMLHIRTWDRKVQCADRILPRDGMSVQLMRLRMNPQLHPSLGVWEPPRNALDSHHCHVLSVHNRGRDDSQAPTESY